MVEQRVTGLYQEPSAKEENSWRNGEREGGKGRAGGYGQMS